ncbi:MAG: glycoside hydrolase [Actinobacteria bacterium]|nr:glycoside hydrolase [Actinomycetota bacterium]
MRLRALVPLAMAVVLGLTLLGTASAVSRPPLVQRKLDLVTSNPLSPDIVGGEVPGPGAGGAAGAGPPPRVGPDVIVNAAQIGLPNGLVGRSETSITLHGQNLVAGWNDADGFCGEPLFLCGPLAPGQVGLSGFGFSTDGGQTWTDGGAPPVIDGIFTSGDPWLDNNGAGTFYYANLAFDENVSSLGVSVHRGGFSGGSFAWTDATSFDSPNNAVMPGFDFYDKEALAAGKNQNRNDAYVTLTNFLGQPFIGPPPGCGVLPTFGFGQIEVWRTHDGGDTWQGPTIAGPERPDSVASCGNEGTLQQSSAPAVGPNGDVYVVWQLGPTFNALGQTSADADIVFVRSTDGGVTFSTPTTVADINSSRANPPLGYNRSRVNDHPRIEVALTGKHKGRIYVTYYSSVSPVPSASNPVNQQTLVNIQTFLKHSDDGGQTWSAAKEIGGPLPTTLPTGVGAIKRHWPDVSVSPGGEVHVVYVEEQATQLTPDPTDVECNRSHDVAGQNRVGPFSSLVETWWTFSKDGGDSWSMPLKLSSGASRWCTPSGNVGSNIRPNMGDYIDAQAGPGLKVYGLWSDGRDAAPIPAAGPGLFLVVGSGFAAGKS